MTKLETILQRLLRERPGLANAEALLRDKRITVDGVPVDNPRTLVRRDARVRIAVDEPLRGTRKLAFALRAFGIDAQGRIALDVGASTGGFTAALLAAGAERVYAVDVGHGQLLGGLRLDPRVVNLERTNLAELDRRLVPEVVELVTIDLSYLAIADAIGQLGAIDLAPGAELVALVKPMFELGLARAPQDHESLAEALLSATAAAEAHGWIARAATASPQRGAGGAREGLLHARRA